MSLQDTALSLVGTVAMRPELLPVARAFLPTADLLQGDAARAWRVILSSTDNGRLDPARLHEGMGRDRAAESFWIAAQQRILNPYATDEKQVEAWAGALLEDGQTRRTTALLRATAERLEQGTVTLDEAIGEGMQQLSAAREGGGLSWASLGDTSRAAREMFAAWQRGERSAGGVPTGFWSLDSAIDALPHGETIVVAGRPSQGKTQLALQVGLNVARRWLKQSDPRRVAFFSAETGGTRLSARLASARIGIPSKRFQRGYASDEEWSRLYAALDEQEELAEHFYIDDTPAPTTDTLLSRAMALHHSTIDGERRPVGLLVFDYLELAGNRGDSEEQRVSGISRACKQIAQLLGCPFILLSQLSRQVEGRNPPMPQLSDLRYSGAIEADAYMVLACYRPGYYFERGRTNLADYNRSLDPHGTQAFLSLLKNKDGEAGINIPMHFEGGLWHDPESPDKGGWG